MGADQMFTPHMNNSIHNTYLSLYRWIPVYDAFDGATLITDEFVGEPIRFSDTCHPFLLPSDYHSANHHLPHSCYP